MYSQSPFFVNQSTHIEVLKSFGVPYPMSMNTIRQLRTYANTKLFAGDYQHALHAYALLVDFQPNDLDARLRVADTLLALGEVPAAVVLYTTFARHAANAGYPFRALIALKILETLEPSFAELLDAFATLYSKESTRLGRSTKLSLGDPDLEIPNTIHFDDPPAPEELLPAAAQKAASLDKIAAYPGKTSSGPAFKRASAKCLCACSQSFEINAKTSP